MILRTFVRRLVVGLLFVVHAATASTASDYNVFLTGTRTNMTQSLLMKYRPGQFSPEEFPLAVDQVGFGMATDGHNIYLLTGDRMDKYSREGSFLGTFADLSSSLPSPSHLQRDPQGNFYASSFSSTRALKLDADGNVLTTIPGLGGVFGVNGDEQGRIFVSLRNELRQYNSSGQLEVTIPTSFFFNSDIAIDHQLQKLYHASQNGFLSRYDISGASPILEETIKLPIDINLFMNFDAFTGDLFVTGATSAWELTTAGQIVHTFGLGYVLGGIVAVPVPEPSGALALTVASLLWCRLCRRERHWMRD